MLPRHIINVPEDKKAIAPYNFVELPNNIIEVKSESLPQENSYSFQSENRYTGRVECKLTTKSPLYIRCGLTKEEFECGTESKDLPDFFYTQLEHKGKKPVLPASSLRGMLRSIVEIISFSKIDRVSESQRLFFRAVAANREKDSLGRAYKRHIYPKKVQAGYLKKDSQGWYVQPTISCNGSSFAWVRQANLELPDLKIFDDDNYCPQYLNVSYTSVKIDNTDKAKRLFAHNVDLPNTHLKKGVLVTSGNMKQGSKDSPRRNHCVVFEADSNSTKLRIDDKAIEHYRNALTDFQKKAPFDKNFGILEEERPVFYSLNEDESTVGFFGQSPNFRIAYSPQGNGHAKTVVDFIPSDLKNPLVIDLADAIFGWVKEDKNLPEDMRQRGSRVFISDANYQSAENGIWYKGNPNDTLTPQIMSEPKVTCFQHYLVQPNETEADKSKLEHYASTPIEKTVIRGHKLYWHKGSNPVINHPNPNNAPETQLTKIKPINKGVNFDVNIDFENLSDVELGALLWVVSISSNKAQVFGIGDKDKEYCLSLGMGKPLGMGSIKIEHQLYLSNRTSRYQTLFDGNKWNEAEQLVTDEQQINFIQAFENYIAEFVSDDDKPNDGKVNNLKDLRRIKMLLAMLRWDAPSDVERETRYMEIERDVNKFPIGKPTKASDPTVNEYKERFVLPTPLQIMDITDNRKLPTNLTPSTSPVEKPILKNKQIAKDSKSNKHGYHSGNGTKFNSATARPKKPRS
ncbi:CRISPR-associated RAMP family protein [Dulcicalothrix desertica PCC 7102]|uniref:CRISPR-associated RAMP family protein n=1 Tax=Dulcicalothrix desertica PCC 7102 TaxID=232991 RepID=A0A3S1CBC1_9CYAN|nr:TIGR03986 family CRISPR-associated RAMP protein [Dulcicalothrix desertica]RUS98584.1 CRISPR-associated RAMP family protein [Dulcicalothrix desertica PCC 7102]TWH43091.1 CRISPR-associated protein (TIGR03986 family) [Dulcicalothrix desertica PCC 7102]